jgi:hypothetical protein
MLIGGACYVVYLAGLVHINRVVVCLLSSVIGWGSAVLWVALGVFVTHNSTKATRATTTGMFWSIFQVCAMPIVPHCVARL